MFGARCTKYQLEPAPLPSVSSARRAAALAPREGHGLGAGLDDAGAHDLVGGLGGLAGAARRRNASMVLPMRCEHRPRALERPRVAADHDGERAVLRAFDAAADRRIEELRRRASRSSCAALRAVSALTVEQSMTRAPGAGRARARRRLRARRHRRRRTITTTSLSAREVSEPGDGGAAEFRWRAPAALSGLRFQTALSRPACADCAPCPGPWRRGRRNPTRRVTCTSRPSIALAEARAASSSASLRYLRWPSGSARTGAANSCTCRSARALSLQLLALSRVSRQLRGLLLILVLARCVLIGLVCVLHALRCCPRRASCTATVSVLLRLNVETLAPAACRLVGVQHVAVFVLDTCRRRPRLDQPRTRRAAVSTTSDHNMSFSV